MSPQETFDTVASHLLTQNRKSTSFVTRSARIMCAYRGDEGCKCAAGVLIPDNKYDPYMEGGNVVPATRADMTEASQLVTSCIECEGHDTRLVRALQVIHDQHEPELWKERLASEAARFGLSAAVLSEFEAVPA